MKNQFKKINSNSLFRIILIIIIVIVIMMFVLSFLKSSNDSIQFYKDNCPKLKAKLLESYDMCYKVDNNVITYYNIETINGKNYLRENTQFMGVQRK